MNVLHAILLLVLFSGPTVSAQAGPHEENAAMTPDRATWGLRGPVRSCTEESGFQPPNGAEVHFEYTTEFDPAGRITLHRSRNTDGSYWATRYEYGPSGPLLKIASGTEGKEATESHYSYDQQERLQRITTDGKAETPVTLRYDERGRKTKIEVSRPEDYRPNFATGGSPFEAADRAPNLPGGGSATTIYDEQDRPTEVEVRDAKGELISHALRKYDAEGHVTEEKQILDNLISMVPPEARAKMLEESGLSPDRLRQELGAQLTKLMAGRVETYSVSYRYDSSGHLIHTSRRIFNQEEEIETTYNEHGDVASEITRGTKLATEIESTGAGASPSYSEAQYSYEYDQHGNWIVKSVSYRSSPDGEFQSSSVEKRSLTYY